MSTIEMAGPAPPEVPHLPDKVLLIDRLVRSLDFARHTIEHLIIKGHSAPKDAPWYVQPEKILAESAFLMVFANANKTLPPVKEAMTALAKTLEPLARSKAMMLNICLRPDLALDYAHAHICLSSLGYPSTTFDAALLDALHSEAANGIERTPHRMMERSWLLNLWGKYQTEDRLDFWAPLSCLHHPADLFSESTDGVYALTHAIMYSAFFKKEIHGADTDELFRFVEALLVRYMDQQDYDIAGELLLAWPLSGKKMGPAAIFALHCLLNIESRVGFLPAPNLDPAMIEGKAKKNRRTYIYSINYHTVLVMGLLCGKLLETYGLPYDLATESAYPIPLSPWMRKELTKGKTVHWQEYFGHLSPSQKQALTPWIYQSLLMRSVLGKNYREVKNLLELARGTEIESMPLNRQAGELLYRLGRNVEN